MFFQKKGGGDIFENLSENVQNLKIFEKEWPHECNYRMHKTARI